MFTIKMKPKDTKKITLKRFLFAPTMSLFDIVLWVTFAFNAELFGRTIGFFVGYLLILYLFFLSSYIRDWGEK